MEATRTQMRTTINSILLSFGIDDLELEFKLVDGLWNLAHPETGERKQLTAAQVKEQTLAAMNRGATKVEQIKTALWNQFRMYYPLDTRAGKAFLQFLVEHDAMGERVDQFADWWWHKHWRGLDKKQPPDNIQMIVTYWPQAFIEQQASSQPEYKSMQPDGGIHV